MIVSFTLPGQPVGKGRPRLSTRGGFARAYTPAKTRAYEADLAAAALDAMDGHPPVEGPVSMELYATFAIPKSWTKRDTNLALTGYKLHTSKPDADNIAKCGDALNGIVFKDDSQIVRLSVSKVYGPTPGLHVEVREA